jgi:hypothetical protein
MNESTLTQLKVIVERAVRPVRASTSRKRKMREELLAHVSVVFEEEFAQLGDDRAALVRTALRFGNAAEVTSQLQESVPASDGIRRFWEGRPGESTLRGALRLACEFEVFVLFICGVSLFVTGWLNAWSSADVIAVISSLGFVPQWSFGPLWLVGIAFVAHWTENALRNPAGPPAGWPRIGLKQSCTSAWAVPAVRVALIAGGLCFFLLLCIRSANWSTEPADWDHWTQIVAGVLLAGDMAATSVLCAWVLVQSADERRRYHEEWASLQIDSEGGAPA